MKRFHGTIALQWLAEHQPLALGSILRWRETVDNGVLALESTHLGDIELSPFATGNGLVVWFLRRIYDLHTTNVLIYS